MKTNLSKGFVTSVLLTLTTTAYADLETEVNDSGIYETAPSAFLMVAATDERQTKRRGRRGSYHGHERVDTRIWPNRQDRGFRESFGNNNRQNFGRIGKGRQSGARRDASFFSYTSPPLRGGSSRRTRIIENPYSDRLVTGITLTGVDSREVHIRDVVAYPGRQLVSPLAYSLSQYSRPRFINTYNYIDYISVAAKRKEYFTVTFHYD